MRAEALVSTIVRTWGATIGITEGCPQWVPDRNGPRWLTLATAGTSGGIAAFCLRSPRPHRPAIVGTMDTIRRAGAPRRQPTTVRREALGRPLAGTQHEYTATPSP